MLRKAFIAGCMTNEFIDNYMNVKQKYDMCDILLSF